MPMIDGSRYDPPSLSKDCSIINVQLIEIPLAPGIFWMDGRQPEAIHKRGSRRLAGLVSGSRLLSNDWSVTADAFAGTDLTLR
jgi:hypothetical protein